MSTQPQIVITQVAPQTDKIVTVSGANQDIDIGDYSFTAKDGMFETVTGDVVASTGFYIGDETTDGSWRFVPSGTSLKVERRESGSWVEKGEFTA